MRHPLVCKYTMTLPNLLTLFRIGLTPLFVLLVLSRHLEGALFVFFIAGMTDGLDGLIARLLHQKSSLGAFLDPLADKILLMSAAITLSWIGVIPLWLAFLIVLRDISILFGVSLLVIAEIPFEIRPSLLGKLTTLSQIITIIVVLIATIAPLPYGTIPTLFVLSALCTVTSGAHYVSHWYSLWITRDGRLRLTGRLLSSLHRLWYTSPRPISPLLEALSVPYLFCLSVSRRLSEDKKVRPPSFVISVGNITLGGTGKTPFTLWLAGWFHERGYRPLVICRTMGRRRTFPPTRVPPGGSQRDVLLYGDEPLLLARSLPQVSVWAGTSKSDVARVGEEQERPHVIIVDDGAQHWRLERDLEIMLFTEEYGVGNGRLFPFGPLREPREALRRADAIVLVGGGTSPPRGSCVEQIAPFTRRDTPWFRLRRVVRRVVVGNATFSLTVLRGTRCLAFAGVAHPELFFNALRDAGVVLCRTLHFPDHHHYTLEEIESIVRDAHISSARLILTTQKDILRLPDDVADAIGYVPLELEECSGTLRAWLEERITIARKAVHERTHDD